MLASGATPRNLPSEAAPVPATVAAMWVPWPSGSSGTSRPAQDLSITTLGIRPGISRRSGWMSPVCPASRPLSAMAAMRPFPVSPAGTAKPGTFTAAAPVISAARSLRNDTGWERPAGGSARSPAARGDKNNTAGSIRHTVMKRAAARGALKLK